MDNTVLDNLSWTGGRTMRRAVVWSLRSMADCTPSADPGIASLPFVATVCDSDAPIPERYCTTNVPVGASTMMSPPPGTAVIVYVPLPVKFLVCKLNTHSEPSKTN